MGHAVSKSFGFMDPALLGNVGIVGASELRLSVRCTLQVVDVISYSTNTGRSVFCNEYLAIHDSDTDCFRQSLSYATSRLSCAEQ